MSRQRKPEAPVFRIEPMLELIRDGFLPRAGAAVVLVTLGERQFPLNPWDAERMAVDALELARKRQERGVPPEAWHTFENRSLGLSFRIRQSQVPLVFRWMYLCAQVAKEAQPMRTFEWRGRRYVR